MGLGSFKDDPKLLRQAIVYLAQFTAFPPAHETTEPLSPAGLAPGKGDA
jgi:hypothetical protein